MSKPWPPPPDLESIKELVRDADIEGFIEIHGAPSDEYDTEAESLHKSIEHFATAEISGARLLPIIETIWRKSFSLDDNDLAQRKPALTALTQQIERFFGPEAKPQVRNA